jgi:hypothetical protein
VLRVSAAPAIGVFERVTGARAAEAVIASIESSVRSWVRHAEPPPSSDLDAVGVPADDQG